MKTTLKALSVFAGLLLLAGCAANAGDTPNQTACPGYGPGWRQEQMIQARQDGTAPPCRMGMRGQGFGPGQGMGMRGPGPAALNADGTVDTTKLPAWCPYATKADTTPKTE